MHAQIVAAYLMKVEELSRDAAIQSIKFSRPGIQPNPGEYLETELGFHGALGFV